MKVSDFDYELPPELIAQHPPSAREEARQVKKRKNYDRHRKEEQLDRKPGLDRPHMRGVMPRRLLKYPSCFHLYSGRGRFCGSLRRESCPSNSTKTTPKTTPVLKRPGYSSPPKTEIFSRRGVEALFIPRRPFISILWRKARYMLLSNGLHRHLEGSPSWRDRLEDVHL